MRYIIFNKYNNYHLQVFNDKNEIIFDNKELKYHEMLDKKKPKNTFYDIDHLFHTKFDDKSVCERYELSNFNRTSKKYKVIVTIWANRAPNFKIINEV